MTATKKAPVLVVLQMSGAYDALNTFIPYSDPLYMDYRPVLKVEPEQVLAVTDQVGFHPAMAPLKALYDEGKVAVLQGIGYPLFEKTIANLHDQFSKGRYGFTTWTFWPNASNSYVMEGIEQVWLNRITTEAFLTRLQTLFAQEFREGKVPPLPPRTA